MKCHIPQISWHSRDPVLSIDFQMLQGNVRRLATAGTDTHVLIWLVTLTSGSSISLEFASDLSRHTKPVNIVRFSPNGEILASGDDEASIILWKQQERGNEDVFSEEYKENKEQWNPLKMLRGHLDDVSDLYWSADSSYLVSGSVDNTAILWDIQKGKSMGLFADSKGFVQGVTWDPLNQYIATLSSDRSLRIYNIQGKRALYKVQKALLPTGTEQVASTKPLRIFYDDTLKSFCRRLTFSPDGELLIVPSGIIELEDGKILNTTYVFPRHALNKPALHLPTGNKYTLAVRCSPILYELRRIEHNTKKEIQENETDKQVHSLFSLPYRIIFAVATQDSVLLYDTQQSIPFAHVSNIHYTHLTDLAWSPDGRILMVSSTDGYCSFIIFAEGELGYPYNGTASSNSSSVQNSSAVAKDSKDNFVSKSQTCAENVWEQKQKLELANTEPYKEIDILNNEQCKQIDFHNSDKPELNTLYKKDLQHTVDSMEINYLLANSHLNKQTDLHIASNSESKEKIAFNCALNSDLCTRVIDESTNLQSKNINDPEVTKSDWELVLEPSHENTCLEVNEFGENTTEINTSPTEQNLTKLHSESMRGQKPGRRVKLITLSGKASSKFQY